MSLSSKYMFKTHPSPSRAWTERCLWIVLAVCASMSILTTIGIFAFFFVEAIGFFSHVNLVDFFFGKEWYPLLEPRSFGILPIAAGSLMIAGGALVLALPLGLLTAIYLSEYVSRYLRFFVKSILEILAGIPTVVYGFLALTFVTPILREILPQTEVFNALSAVIVVALMVVPTIASISQDALEAVPRHLKEAAYGLGARKYQVILTVVFPAAFSGFVASVILAFSRALGETMAVTLAAGATPKLTLNFLESIQTMTAYIVQVSLGDTPAGTLEYQSLFAVGLVLFGITFFTNLIAQFFVTRIHQKYL